MSKSNKIPRFVPPFSIPRVPQPSDNPNTDPSFRLDASELHMWDTFAQEPIQAAGTDGRLWQFNLAQSTIDPIYSEPSGLTYVGPYLLRVQIEWPETTPEATDEGMLTVWPSGAWIPRKSLEDIQAREPRVGDVLHFWALPFFDNRASNYQGSTNAGYFFDIIKVVEDGHLIDNSAFVAFRCDLKRRSAFGAEQLFIPPRDPHAPC